MNKFPFIYAFGSSSKGVIKKREKNGKLKNWAMKRPENWKMREKRTGFAFSIRFFNEFKDHKLY